MSASLGGMHGEEVRGVSRLGRQAGDVVRTVLAIVVVLALSACTETGPGPTRPPVDDALAAVVDGLSRGDLSDAPVDDPATAEAALASILQGMDAHRPAITAGEPRTVGEARQVTLQLDWDLGGSHWRYDTIATFVPVDNGWQLQWKPTVVHPELTSLNRLAHTRSTAERGRIIGAGGTTLAEKMPVVRLGIDKARMDADGAKKSAARLAKTLEINSASYVERVAKAGEKAFVEALVLRGRGKDVPDEFFDIPGARLIRDEWVLSTKRGRAEAVIGQVGEATKEIVEQSKGAVRAGDRVGLTGLQRRYDERLRGAPGSTVKLVDRPKATPSSSPSSGNSPSSGTTPGQSDPVELFTSKPVPGKDLVISLDASLQDKAAGAIADESTAVAMAVVRPSNGAVLALATNEAAGGQPLANFGRFAPGSTFKVATALALLRSGMTAQSSVECTEFITVGGRKFKNYSDFPTDRLGRMTLTDAIATSCNTALISQHERLSGARLREAAISLGMGTDHDAGFPAFYGEVPDPADVVGLAAAEIGQGTVEASPMAMAGMAGSVAAGRTVVPWLIKSNRPQQKGKPLGKDEAKQLRAMMSEAVDSGTARTLQGVAVGGKTGTAEYGTEDPPRTNAWMIAYTDSDLAVAVFVTDGESGSDDAAPLIRKFLS